MGYPVPYCPVSGLENLYEQTTGDVMVPAVPPSQDEYAKWWERYETWLETRVFPWAIANGIYKDGEDLPDWLEDLCNCVECSWEDMQ